METSGSDMTANNFTTNVILVVDDVIYISYDL